MSEKVIIFDTTLRDGEQSPGASLNLAEKLEVARALAAMKVDAIEAGFPASSPGDFEAVHAVAEQIDGPIIAGLSRCMDKDIQCCWDAVKPSKRPRVHTFIATSDIHMEKKLRKPPEAVLQMAVAGVTFARSLCPDVEFSCEDATRTRPEFLAQVVQAVIEAGASTVNIPDTVGYTNPWEYEKLIRYLFEHVKNVDKAVISVHCHNDLGLGVPNSLAAVLGGARQVECTINGLGERAGNASLEEIVMNLKVRADFFKLSTNVDTTRLYPTSRLVSNLTGIAVQRNKAIVGQNAFAHEAGIHQDGMLKERETYEIMRPEDVGVPGSSMVLGKHSGRNAFRTRLKDLGYDLDDEMLNKAFDQFKVLADKKKDIFDEDLQVIVEQEARELAEVFHLDYVLTTSGTTIEPVATVRMRQGEQKFSEASCGDGPVDAVYQAIRKITNTQSQLTNYQLKAITGGTDAQGEVRVVLEEEGLKASGVGTDTDVIIASAKAYVNAINRLLYMKSHRAQSAK